MLNVPMFGWSMAFVRPDEPMLYANAVNIQSVNTTIAPLTLQDFFSLQNSYDNQQAYVPNNPGTFSQTFELTPGRQNDIKIGLAQQNTQLLPGLYEDLGRHPFHNPTEGGLSMYGDGRGCNELDGAFAVDEISYDAQGIVSFSIRFVQRCEITGPPLYGAMRWTRPGG